MHVLYVKVSRFIILYSEYSSMVVQELQAVTLLDEVSVRSKKTDRQSGLEKLVLKII